MPRHRPDCRYFDGIRPCHRATACETCDAFEARGPRMLLILCGRLGDVVMATALATALADQHPSLHLTWLTDTAAAPLLAEHPQVNRVLAFDLTAVLTLQAEHFDRVINLDRSTAACALTMQLSADRKCGFGYSRTGTMIPLDTFTEALFDINRYPLRRAANDRSWATLYQAVAGLDDTLSPPPSLYLGPAEEELARAWRRQVAGARRRLVLCAVGSHARDTQKRWPLAHWADLWARLARRPGVVLVLHAGPDEADLHAEAIALCPAALHNAGIVTTLREAMVRISAADVVVTADSLALHLAMALTRPAVGLFGPTNPAFVQPTATLTKLRGRPDCPPCHARQCHHAADANPRPCLAEITPESVEWAVGRALDRSAVTAVSEKGSTDAV